MAAAGVLLSVGPAAGQYLDQVGYTALQARLGAAAPTGAGVAVAQVEASEGPNRFAPDPAVTTASGRPAPTVRTANSSAASGHATAVADVFYGRDTMAGGVTKVDAWEANDWINRTLYPTVGGVTGAPVTAGQPRVSNHSYIGELDAPFTAADAADLSVRADYFVANSRQVMVVAVGSNANQPGTGAPAAAFGNVSNGITVGRSDGNHLGGLTTLDVPGQLTPGRVKPDLVAPLGAVSYATPAVAAAATLLVQSAGTTPAGDPAAVKAMLMAGAKKDPFPDWNRTTARPLDLRYGAGQVNIDNSHRILEAGQQPASASATVASTGWDVNTVSTSTARQTYFFDVAADAPAKSLSAVLTWNRSVRVTGTDADGNAVLTADPLADLNLALYRANGFALAGGPIDQSLSMVDNVEHVWLTAGLTPGRYAFTVDLNGTAGSEYALAWQVLYTPVPEPAFGLVVIAVVTVGWFGVSGSATGRPSARRADR
jgi:hypothetical protein